MAKQVFFGVGDAARILGVPAWRIGRLFDELRLPEPPRVAGRRLIAPELLPRIAELLGVKTNNYGAR